MGYGLGIDVGTRAVVSAIQEGDDQRVLNQVINPPAGPDVAVETRRQAFAIRRALRSAAEVGGNAPQAVVLTYPAGSGEQGLDLVRRAAEQARLDAPYLISDIEAAATYHVFLGRCAEGELLAAVDLGDIDHTVRALNPEDTDQDTDEDPAGPGTDQVTVALLYVTRAGARLFGPARTLPVVQSAPAMHAQVSTALRSLLTAAGVEPGQVSGLLLMGEGVWAPGATGRLAERLVEHLGPALGVSTTLMSAPAHSAALGAAGISTRPDILDADDDVDEVAVRRRRPERPAEPAFPLHLVRTAVGPVRGRLRLGALAAGVAVTAVGAGAFALYGAGWPSGAGSTDADANRLHLRVPAIEGAPTATGPTSAPTSVRPAAQTLPLPTGTTVTTAATTTGSPSASSPTRTGTGGTTGSAPSTSISGSGVTTSGPTTTTTTTSTTGSSSSSTTSASSSSTTSAADQSTDRPGGNGGGHRGPGGDDGHSGGGGPPGRRH